MQVHTKKHPTDYFVTMRLHVRRSNVRQVERYAASLEHAETGSYSVAEVFPEYVGTGKELALRAYRLREGLTQKQLAERTGISQHHISELETGKRTIGKERAKKLAEALHCDYRQLL